jgi:hypothetical protein
MLAADGRRLRQGIRIDAFTRAALPRRCPPAEALRATAGERSSRRRVSLNHLHRTTANGRRTWTDHSVRVDRGPEIAQIIASDERYRRRVDAVFAQSARRPREWNSARIRFQLVESGRVQGSVRRTGADAVTAVAHQIRLPRRNPRVAIRKCLSPDVKRDSVRLLDGPLDFSAPRAPTLGGNAGVDRPRSTGSPRAEKSESPVERSRRPRVPRRPLRSGSRGAMWGTRQEE